ncbi:hypothetical protein LSAT2_006595 [Lamellibrachia satsuma]|nr:hypothetical protein LSAT2_006595 [Lamellibrachia satsuma]
MIARPAMQHPKMCVMNPVGNPWMPMQPVMGPMQPVFMPGAAPPPLAVGSQPVSIAPASPSPLMFPQQPMFMAQQDRTTQPPIAWMMQPAKPQHIPQMIHQPNPPVPYQTIPPQPTLSQPAPDERRSPQGQLCESGTNISANKSGRNATSWCGVPPEPSTSSRSTQTGQSPRRIYKKGRPIGKRSRVSHSNRFGYLRHQENKQSYNKARRFVPILYRSESPIIRQLLPAPKPRKRK